MKETNNLDMFGNKNICPDATTIAMSSQTIVVLPASPANISPGEARCYAIAPGKQGKKGWYQVVPNMKLGA